MRRMVEEVVQLLSQQGEGEGRPLCEKAVLPFPPLHLGPATPPGQEAVYLQGGAMWLLLMGVPLERPSAHAQGWPWSPATQPGRGSVSLAQRGEEESSVFPLSGVSMSQFTTF